MINKWSMKEQDLIDLGFEKRIDDIDQDDVYYFYVYDFTKDFSLISSTNFENDGDWFVEIFEDYRIRFYDKDDVKTLIDVVNRNNRYALKPNNQS